MTTVADVSAPPAAIAGNKVLSYLRLGKARIYHHAYGWVLALLLLDHEGRLRGEHTLGAILLLVGLVVSQWAAGAADDIGGYRDGSDARNYKGRPARTIAKKPLVTGALTEREAVRFLTVCSIVGLACAPLAYWALDGDVPIGALVVGLVGQVLAVQYSLGLRISYRPLGLETQILLTTALLALVPYWAIGGTVTRSGLLVSALVGVWFLLVVAHGNASDREGDASVNRKTLAVLLPPEKFRMLLPIPFVASVTLLVVLFATELKTAAILCVVPVTLVHVAQQYYGAFKQNWRKARFMGLISLDVGCLGLALAIALS